MFYISKSVFSKILLMISLTRGCIIDNSVVFPNAACFKHLWSDHPHLTDLIVVASIYNVCCIIFNSGLLYQRRHRYSHKSSLFCMIHVSISSEKDTDLVYWLFGHCSVTLLHVLVYTSIKK